RDGPSPRAGINPNQNETCQVTQRPLIGRELPAFVGPAMACLNFAVTPTSPKQASRFRTSEPSLTWRALRRKPDIHNRAMEVFRCVMTDGRAQVLQVTPRPAGVAASLNVFLARRRRYIRQHASAPKGIQARDASFKLFPVGLVVATIFEVDRQHVGDVDLFDIACLAGRAILVRD